MIERPYLSEYGGGGVEDNSSALASIRTCTQVHPTAPYTYIYPHTWNYAYTHTHTYTYHIHTTCRKNGKEEERKECSVRRRKDG